MIGSPRDRRRISPSNRRAALRQAASRCALPARSGGLSRDSIAAPDHRGGTPQTVGDRAGIQPAQVPHRLAQALLPRQGPPGPPEDGPMDSSRPHRVSRLPDTSRSLLSKPPTSLRRFSAPSSGNSVSAKKPSAMGRQKKRGRHCSMRRQPGRIVCD